jgi:tetratricopeptide (TPR) repeat protein
VAHIAHVGDSRIYMVRQDKLVQMTTDHTKVEDLKRAGIINKEEAKKHPERSTLQRALGVKEHVRVDLSSDIRVKADDIFILCTDGLAQVKKDELASIVQNESPHTACQKFIALANERGGGDNSTVQVIKIEKGIQEQRATGKQKIFFQRPLWFGLGILALIFILTMMYISSDYGKIDSRSPAVQFNDSRSEMDEITGLFDRARKYTSRNRYEDAVQAYQEILMINPLDTDALSELDQIAARMIREGEKFDRQGNTGQALRYFRQAYDIRPRDKKLAEIIRKLEQR